MIHSALHHWSLDGERVLVRADLNVSLKDDTVVSDYKLSTLLATLECIRAKNGSIILMSHIGRPTSVTPALSTRHLIPWFTRHGYSIVHAETIEHAQRLTPGTQEIILLENLRFFEGEKARQRAFAQSLAALGDYFVQDAFGSLQNDDASMTVVPLLFPVKKRSIGLVIENELAQLTPIMHHPRHPFVTIVGGSKISSKLPFLQRMLNHADTIVLLPAIAFTFLKALGQPTGLSLVDYKALDACNDFLAHARKNNVSIILPVDYYIKEAICCLLPRFSTAAHSLPKNAFGIACGPGTLAAIDTLCRNAQTIVLNGLMGFIRNPSTLTSMHTLFESIAACDAKSIIGGGDTVAALEYFHMVDAFDHISTGGGAMLALMSGHSLPGLQPFTTD